MTNLEFAQALRELADLYQQDARMIPPDFRFYISAERETLQGHIKALATGGRVRKMPPRDRDDYFYKFERTLPSGVNVEFHVSRSQICRRVTRMELVETWECPDSLLEGEDGPPIQSLASPQEPNPGAQGGQK